jgi:hypothetical protein
VPKTRNREAAPVVFHPKPDTASTAHPFFNRFLRILWLNHLGSGPTIPPPFCDEGCLSRTKENTFQPDFGHSTFNPGRQMHRIEEAFGGAMAPLTERPQPAAIPGFHPGFVTLFKGAVMEVYRNYDSPSHYCGVCCFPRPPSIRLASVPAGWKQVIERGHALKVIQVGTSPLWASESPTTLRVCSFADGPGLPSLGCPSGRFLPPDM